jgi:hypothetical protein
VTVLASDSSRSEVAESTVRVTKSAVTVITPQSPVSVTVVWGRSIKTGCFCSQLASPFVSINRVPGSSEDESEVAGGGVAVGVAVEVADDVDDAASLLSAPVATPPQPARSTPPSATPALNNT